MTKQTKWVCVKRRLRLACPVWPESSLSARRNLGFLTIHWALSEESNQTAQADLSLRWAHTHFVRFVMSWLIFNSSEQSLCDPVHSIFKAMMFNCAVPFISYWMLDFQPSKDPDNSLLNSTVYSELLIYSWLEGFSKTLGSYPGASRNVQDYKHL